MSNNTQALARPDSVTNAEMALIGGDALRSREAALKAKQQAVEMDLPLDGITILGGKVYVNNKGLTIMLRRDERGPGSVAVEVVKDAWDDCILDTIRQRMGSTSKDAAARWADAGLMRAKCKARISFPDGSHYEAYGDASIITMGMPAMHNPDYANHMSETRSVNRAIRRATGLDTTAEEMVGGVSRDAVTELGLDLTPDADASVAHSSTRPAPSAADAEPQAAENAENEYAQIIALNARITELCAALGDVPPESRDDLVALGKKYGWVLTGTGAASATWKEQLIVRLEIARQRATVTAALAADPDAAAKLPKDADAMTAEELEKTLTWLQNRARRHAPAITEPEPASAEASEPTASSLGEPWTAPDVLNALAAATEKDIDGIAAEISPSVDAFVLTEDLARQLRACVTLARRAFTVTSAGSMAQVEIDAGEMRTNLDITVDQYDALIALTHRVRDMRGWAGSNGTTSRQPAVAAATAGAGGR